MIPGQLSPQPLPFLRSCPNPTASPPSAPERRLDWTMRYKLLPPGKRGPFWYVRGSHERRRFEFSTETKDRAAAQAIADAEISRRLSGALPHQGPITFATA